MAVGGLRLAGVGVAALVAAGSTCAAGSPPPTPATRLDTIVVSATRREDSVADVPASIDVVGGDDLRRARPGLNLAEALPRVPGVVVRDRQNQAQDLQLSIRGFGARATFGVRGVRLYADGIPATMPDGQGQVSHFALDAAQRIEVLRGPFSALYGNSAGGVVAVFSAPPPATAETAGGLLAGSDGLWRAGASWRGPLAASGAHGARVDAARSAADGWRARSGWQRNAAQVQLRGDLGGNGGEYVVLYNGMDLRADDPQGLTAAELDIDRRAASPGSVLFSARKTVEQQQFGARASLPIADAQALELVAWGGRRQTFQMLTVPVAAQANPAHGGGAIDLDRAYRGVDARWQWQGERSALTFGASHEIADEARLGFENFRGTELGVAGRLRRDEDNRVTGSDVYVQADWQPTAQWRINAGVRHSRVRFDSHDHYFAAGNPDDSGELDYERTSPVLGALWRANAQWVFYANVGQGFETPTFAELAYRLDGGSGLNTALRPARSTHVEAGMRWQRGEGHATFALFQSRTRDELVVVANSGGRSYFDNAELSRRRGAEAAFDVALAARWRIAASYTFLDARHLRDFATCGLPPCSGPPSTLIEAGNRIPGLARHTLWSELRWLPSDRTDVLLEARATSAIVANDRGDASAPGHALFALGVEHRFGADAEARGLAWRAFARIDNLLDRDVIGSVIVNDGNGRYYEPSPGRTWQVGLNATWR